jgi:tRNA-2-methylthio-N6-dimethylallyladenosine synthase
MNRSHDASSYLRILDRVRAARPDIAISGDFIVGFPGETDAEFEETLKIVEAVNYAQAFSFKYSPRPGTPAADMEDQIPADVMDERLQRLQALLNARQLAFNQAKVGLRTELLLERPGRKPGQKIGKTPWLQSVHLETDAAIGDIVEVELLSAGPNSLAGELVIPAKAGIPGQDVTAFLHEVPAPSTAPAASLRTCFAGTTAGAAA